MEHGERAAPAGLEASDGSTSAALDLLIEFECRVAEGAPANFEALCASRPDLASQLRELRFAADSSGPPTAQPRPARGSMRGATGAEGGGPDPVARLLEFASQSGRAGRYRRSGELGRGAMGAVYEVWDQELSRSLAMKVLAGGDRKDSPQGRMQRLARFVREAQITAQLDHPGIVPVHEFGLDADGRPFFTMKRVGGRELRQVFAAAWSGDKEWSVTRVVGVLLKVCEAVAFAHSKGVVHRDLKPANIMVGGFGEVYVMDWGVAHLAADAPQVAVAEPGEPATDDRDASLTEEGDVIGTAVYMAPEQARGEKDAVGPAIDTYAVGAMLYHLLARRTPYSDGERTPLTRVVLARLLSGPPAPLAELAQDAPSELVSICDKAMSRDIANRYASILLLADDLRAWLEGRVVGAHERGAWAELRKWIGRNRALAAAAATTVVVLCGSLLAFSYLQTERTREANEAAEKIGVERDNAQRAAEKARVEALTSDRTAKFFERMFTGVAPSAGGGQVTVASMLDVGARSLARDLADEPEVRARVSMSVGSAYLGLGLHAQASELLKQALGEARRSSGADARLALEIGLRLAAAAISSGDVQGARAMLEDLEPRCAAPEHAAEDFTVQCAQLFAVVEKLDGRPDAALARLVAAFEGVAFDSDRALRLDGEICQLLMGLGRLDEARERAERRERHASSPGHAQTLSILGKLASMRGDFDAARIYYERARAEQQQAPSTDDPALARTLHELGFLAAQRGDGAEAEDCFRSALGVYERSFGESHPSTLMEQTALAALLLQLGRVEQAEPLAVAALAGWRRGGAAFTENWSATLRVLAECCIEQERWAEAEVYARERFERSGPSWRESTRPLLDRIRAELAGADSPDR